MGAQIARAGAGTKRRIVIVQPYFKTGGAEAVAAWAIQAVKTLAPISVLTYDPITPDELNIRFGTDLKSGDFELERCPFPVFSRRMNERFTLLKLHWLMRQCKRWPDREALFFSASSEMDFGRPGIQYIDFPQFAERAVHDMGLFPSHKWYHRPSWLRTVYLGLGRLISGFSEDGVKINLTLTVSNWTGEVVGKVYGIPTKTVYPPVTLDFPAVPFYERERGFVCVGRVVPAKRILEIIRILDAVRREGFDIHLHIIGPVGSRSYMRKVEETRRKLGSWIAIEGPINREQLAEMLARHRYGIHGMLNEHFGIAVAEMAKAGCIVFVPNSGGQVEIVEGDDRVLYGSEEETIEKIVRVLANEKEQVRLSRDMAARGARFSPEHFMKGIREAVEEVL